MKKIYFIAFTLILSVTSGLWALPEISATIDQANYNIGDQVRVTINMSNPENIASHGLYFKLTYDGNILDFEGLDEGAVIKNETREKDFLYVVTDPATSAVRGDSVVVSYALTGDKVVSTLSGTLCVLNFRIIAPGSSGNNHSFGFKAYGMEDGSGNKINAIWQNSGSFRIGNTSTNVFIIIREPYQNQVFYASEANVNAILSNGRGYRVVLSNDDTGYKSTPILSENGSLTNKTVPLTYGFNRIKAELFDTNNFLVTSDTIRVYRSKDDKYVKIIHPLDHTLVNTDSVSVKVASSFTGVSVNGANATLLGEKYNDHDVYFSRVWLKKGFNIITATVKTSEGAIYTDRITVYYEKDDTIFRFTSPLDGQVYKAGNQSILIKGEISSLYNDANVPNTVNVSVYYHPKNKLIPDKLLIYNEPCNIIESDIVNGSAPYMFVLDKKVSLNGLETGEIEIVGWKNKSGMKCDSEIHRYVYVDSNRLWIELVQPNIYSEENLDSLYKVTKFNNNTDIDSDIEINNNGSFILKNNVNEVSELTNFRNKKLESFIEAPDGTLYLMYNDTGTMRIFKKEPGKKDWTLSVSRSDMYGYNLCYTPVGILIGVSNMFSNANTGLYILKQDKLQNISIGEPLTDVQFIINKNGEIYLYGNNFSYLYNFNIFSLSESNGRLVASNSKKSLFDNTLQIAQFDLNKQKNTAFIRTDDGHVTFYKLVNDSFIPVQLNEIDGKIFKNVLYAEYPDSDYCVYLLYGENDNTYTVMENKYRQELSAYRINLNTNTDIINNGERILGLGSKGEIFNFIVKALDGTFRHVTGRIMFDTFYKEATTVYNSFAYDFNPGSLSLLISDYDAIYLPGLYFDTTKNKNYDRLFKLMIKKQAAGSLHFVYNNPDVEGIKAFSFMLDPRWINLTFDGTDEPVRFGFSVAGTSIAIAKESIKQFINEKSDLYTITCDYDVYSGKYLVYVDFTDLQKKSFINFDMDLKSVDDLSPEISNLIIYNKVIVKVPRPKTASFSIPISGFIYDQSVNEVYINGIKNPLARDRSFYLNYEIKSNQNEVKIEISCINANGNKASLDFIVNIFDSANDMWNIEFRDQDNNVLPFDELDKNVITSDKELLKLSGYYYGLTGAVAGYEQYAYVYNDNVESLVLINKGLLNDTTEDAVIEKNQNSLPVAWPNPKHVANLNGYEYCRFINQKIKLFPGRQRLIVYIENPGGSKTEYLVDVDGTNKYPDIVYNLPFDKQEIVITNDSCDKNFTDALTYSSLTFKKRITLNVNESNAEPYTFSHNLTVYGEVKALSKVYEIKVKSLEAGVFFDNGKQETIIPVDDVGKFSVNVHIRMAEDCENALYHIGFIPTAPYLYAIRTGLLIQANKNFGNTFIKPDFTLMKAEHWSQNELNSLSKKLVLRFNRFIPSSAKINLITNFDSEKMITGKLVSDTDDNVADNYKCYKIVSENDTNSYYSLSLDTGLKIGFNRVQWKIYNNSFPTISASNSAGMEDFMFYITKDNNINFSVDFPVEGGVYYTTKDSGLALPAMLLAKPAMSTVIIGLNSREILNDSSINTSLSVRFQDYALNEGWNNVTVKYISIDKNEQLKSYSFLYDSLAPQVYISAYKYDDNFHEIIKLTARIDEANIKSVSLYYKDTIIDQKPSAYTYMGNNIYEVVWDNLDAYAFADIIPNNDNKITVKVIDKSGNEGISLPFAGVSSSSTKPIETKLFKMNLSSLYYYVNNTAPFIGEQNIPRHAKFYSDSIEVQGNITSHVTVNRPDSITSNANSNSNGIALFANSGKSIILNEGFHAYGNNIVNSVISLNSNYSVLPAVPMFAHNQTSSAISFAFWLRYEHEYYYRQPGSNEYYKIFTLYDGSLGKYFLGYDNSYNLCIVSLATDGSLAGEPRKLNFGNNRNWHLIIASVDNSNNITLSIDTGVPAKYPIENPQIANTILGAGCNYYFGNTDSKLNGHFSIRMPFYTNAVITASDISYLLTNIAGTDNDIPDLYGTELNESQVSAANNYEYHFNSSQDRIVNGANNNYYDLTPFAPDNFYVADENALSSTPGSGALRATSIHHNLLKPTPNGVILSNSQNPVLVNVDAVSLGENFTVTELNPGTYGRYYFGNTFGSNGLKPDKYYSISGNVVELNGTAELVIDINSKEQRFRLQRGYFHFVYNHDGSTPSRAVVYIQLEKGQPGNIPSITLRNDMVLNEGNYALNSSLSRSNVRTNYLFQNTGTISFWYKPLNVNIEGFVNYNTVLFDSPLFKIGASTDTKGIACYYFTYKKAGTTQIGTSIPVRCGWQYVQLTYNLDGNNSCLYLYINDSLAGKHEGFLDNTVLSAELSEIVFGSNMENLVFAEGYLDDVALTTTYNKNLFINRNPVSFSYDDINKLTMNNSLAGFTTATQFILTKKGSADFIKNYTTLGDIDFNSLSSGVFNLKALMLINQYNYENIISFIKDDKPEFLLRDVTPFIIYNDSSADVYLDLEYDNSYIKEVQEAKYAGFVARVNCTGTAADYKNYYITQDFIAQNLANWVALKEENGSWVKIDNTGELSLNITKNRLKLNFIDLNIQNGSPIDWEIYPFYFKNNINIQNIKNSTFLAPLPTPSLKGKINGAALHVEKELYQNLIEYKLNIGITDSSSSDADFSNFEINYLLTSESNSSLQYSGSMKFKDSTVNLYYDDMFKGDDNEATDGKYSCKIYLSYNGFNCDIQEIEVIKSRLKETDTSTSNIYEPKLAITDFSVLYIDKKKNTAKLVLKYDQNNLNNLFYEIFVYDKSNNNNILFHNPNVNIFFSKGFAIINDVPIGEGICDIYLEVYDNVVKDAGLLRKAQLTITNSKNAPEVIFTSEPGSLIGYNNVSFSWRGYYGGEFDSRIEYAYNFDNKGWTVYNTTWRTFEAYNLAEGYHTLKVKAMYNGIESPEITNSFFVDVNKPLFDSLKIHYIKTVVEYGICEKVTIIGDEGAITDASLQYLFMDGERVRLGNNGSFRVEDVELKYDGINRYMFTAFDKVNNFTDFYYDVDNTLTNIMFPVLNKKIVYSPMTILGKINSSISIVLDIYLFDAMSKNTGANDYSGWKKAKINEDRTFFIDNVFVNPGTAERDAGTELTMQVVMPSGKVFKKLISVSANEIIKPIDLTLNTHSAEGELANISVDISCKANVNNISSWSVDFDGDGIYDIVDMVDNPSYGKTHAWSHSYSTLGLVKPKVRVITNDGNFFTATDELIIHEKIKEASNVLVEKPIALSIVPEEDGSSRIFTLSGENGLYKIAVFKVGRNENYISNRLFEISLNGYGIINPVSLKAYDKSNLYLAYNKDNEGYLLLFRENESGNYLLAGNYTIHNQEEFNKIDTDNTGLYASFKDKNSILFVPFVNGNPDLNNMKEIVPEIKNSISLGANSGITKTTGEILLSDYYNQRVVKLSDNFKCISYFGNIGSGEGEFFKPSIIKSWENRIFVYDESRYDIQVFDPNFIKITTLKYNDTSGYANYFSPEFLLNVVDIGVITKEESGKLYYYALILSKSAEKLAMIRLPQWEELRARVRNNKIVFLKNEEVFTAKPDGSDLARLIASDSIPRIEGNLDYPALSPDGKTLVFTSRIVLYNGQSANTQNDNNYTYDNLYVYDLSTKSLTRIPLGIANNYEIERPVFNANGDNIIFSAKKPGSRWQIYVYDFMVGAVRQLFASSENARFPYYSPDDRFVVFTTDYDGDEELEIFDTLNPTVRVSVTSNNARDSYPVWNTIYPFEIPNQDLKIESKIAFVSERNFHKGIYYVYLSRKSPSDIRVVKESGVEIGDDPDTAAKEVTSVQVEGDYPAFTGDGMNLVFEYFNGKNQVLKKYMFDKKTLADVNIPEGTTKPAGMKNTVANFNAISINGDQVKLSWNRYTEQDIPYTVRFRINKEGEPFVQKKVFTQNGTTLEGLDMGVEYLFKVCIIENGEEVASSQWKKVKMPEVAARPTYVTDKDNPYLIKLHAWKPKPETEWLFNWIIDNQEFNFAQSSQDFAYEFGTSGTKTIILKASNKANTYTSISEPMKVNIQSDIVPVIEYSISSDMSTLTCDASKSKGNKIDWSQTLWNISGAGLQSNIIKQGSKAIVDLNGFKSKLNINLSMKRIPLNGQVATDTIEKNLMIDLAFTDIKPVITYEADKSNARLIHFSGENSLGNIDWTRAKWEIFADGTPIYRADSVSTIIYQFPENNNNTNYSVTLTIPRKNDGMTKTSAIIVNVEACPIDPVIEYDIITLKEGMNVTGAKIVFSCQNSKGNNIDYMNAKWSVPLANNYNEQVNQIGPTAVYNLVGIQKRVLIEVSLTLPRKGGTDVKTVTKSILINSDEVPVPDIVINKTVETTNSGRTIVFDILSSKGANIDWEKTEWLLNDQYPARGPVARLDVPEAAESTRIAYVCTVYISGSMPLINKGTIDIAKSVMIPFIGYKKINATINNAYELSVLKTEGSNIDWDRTIWYIHDGNENVIQRQGSKIMHAFAIKSEQFGYPVMVEMFKKGSNSPYVGYASIDVEGDEFTPVIYYDTENITDKNIITFTAEKSLGSNIDWSGAKWTFGDSSEIQYGYAAVHKYPVDNVNKKYTVSLTLNRKLGNGQTETKTTYKELTIGKDDVTPVIYAKLYGNYLVLSCERSEGRGLMFDRSLWTFEGKGDNVNGSVSTQTGKINNSSMNSTVSVSATTGIGASNLSTAIATVTVGGQIQMSDGTTEYENFKNSTDSFSNSNIHTGAICRRTITTEKVIFVTLFVYRMGADGNIVGKSITAVINLNDARSGVEIK